MTYVILHGETNNVKGRISDGALYAHLGIIDGYRKEEWDYQKYCNERAMEVFDLGNYYEDDNEIPGWKSENGWNESKRDFVSNKWLQLKYIIKESISKTGRIDVELLDFFTPDEDKAGNIEWYNQRLRTVMENINRGTIKTKDLINIMDALEEAGY